MMNTRKTQAQVKEDMLLDLYKIHAYNPNDAIGNPLTPFGNFCAGYEACQALNDKRIAEIEEKLRVAREDTVRLDYIQSQTKGYGCGWIFRQSINGRGMRLHETSSINAFKNVREAIDESREALKTIEG